MSPWDPSPKQMKINIENLKDSQILIKIEVEAERVSAVLDEVYGDIGKRAYIPGFRAGKAPRDLLETHYGKTAKDETVDRLAWECYREAVAQKNLDPVGYPIIEEVNFNKDMPLVFTARVDVRPEFRLKTYKGIKVKEGAQQVTDEDVDLALKNLQDSMAQYKNIEDRPIEMSDYIVCDYECYTEAKLVDKKDKLWLYISDQLQPKELLTPLLDTERGVTKEIEVTHPKDYQYKDLAGKKALYKITPRQIKVKILPEINDDLAKETGRFKDLEELKRHLREGILKAKIDQNQRNLENQIFDNLLKAHSFEVPHSLVEKQAQQLVENAKLRLVYQGYKKEDLDKEDEQLKKAVYENAKNNVRLFFILQEIAKEENIEVDDKDLEARIKLLARNSKEDPQELEKRLKEKDLLENLREQMLQDKAVEFLLKEAKKL